jgi:hypothetical protein
MLDQDLRNRIAAFARIARDPKLHAEHEWLRAMADGDLGAVERITAYDVDAPRRAREFAVREARSAPGGTRGNARSLYAWVRERFIAREILTNGPAPGGFDPDFHDRE